MEEGEADCGVLAGVAAAHRGESNSSAAEATGEWEGVEVAVEADGYFALNPDHRVQDVVGHLSPRLASSAMVPDDHCPACAHRRDWRQTLLHFRCSNSMSDCVRLPRSEVWREGSEQSTSAAMP